jgi:hypothetical protein
LQLIPSTIPAGTALRLVANIVANLQNILAAGLREQEYLNNDVAIRN